MVSNLPQGLQRPPHIQNRIEQLKYRLVDKAKVQAAETPSEYHQALLAELDGLTPQL